MSLAFELLLRLESIEALECPWSFDDGDDLAQIRHARWLLF